MNKTIQVLFPILALCLLGGVILLSMALISTQTPLPAEAPVLRRTCTAFCLDNGDRCVFGANQDNTLEIGLLFVNKRHMLKTTWDPSTSGEYARWVSKYGSVTINFVGYQMAWAGMNEAGLMISTMSLAETRDPTPDERPPFNGPFWMQYQLDNHSTVEQVIASDAEIRLVESAVDHYLVCDRTGACATIEFLEGKLVYRTGEGLPVSALTNSTYHDSISAWEESPLKERLSDNNSLWRFTTAANRVRAFEPSSSDAAVAYAFDTLAAVSRQDTVWSFVFDPANLRVHFRTNHNPRVRYVDFSSLDFSCRTPVRLLDVHADVSGDVSDEFIVYTHAASFAHSTSFFSQHEGMSLSPFLVDTLLWGLESFPCQDSDTSTQADLVLYRPMLPPTVSWAGLAVLHRVGPFWIPLVALSLAFVVWRIALGQPSSLGRRLTWVLVTIILGPFGLLAYLLAQRKKRQVAQVS
ncbi:MAG: linear amide C-N hydrolase [Chloroflexi bacterium]|nr:linear amide C-N hydrolase [Chloroflexota bacterium]